VTDTTDFISYMKDLEQAARNANVAEDAFRKDFARKVEELRRARAHAWRRLNLLRVLGRELAGLPEEEVEAKGRAVFYRETAQNGATEPQREAAAQFAPVVLAVWQAVREVPEDETGAGAGEPAPDVRAALATFEDWYAANRNGVFLDLMERDIVELPLVEV